MAQPTTTLIPHTQYPTRPEGRIAYDIRGAGPLVLLVPGVGDTEGHHAVDAVRFLPASLHGLVGHEMSGGFVLPVDMERSRLRLADSVVSAQSTWKR